MDLSMVTVTALSALSASASRLTGILISCAQAGSMAAANATIAIFMCILPRFQLRKRGPAGGIICGGGVGYSNKEGDLMQLGMIGLGRMGANMVRRLMRGGHECVAHDVAPAAVTAIAAEGAHAALTLDEFVAALHTPRTVWLMVPAAVVDSTLDALLPKLSAGDVVIDGGNS